jgi:hypothetical protein
MLHWKRTQKFCARVALVAKVFGFDSRISSCIWALYVAICDLMLVTLIIFGATAWFYRKIDNSAARPRSGFFVCGIHVESLLTIININVNWCVKAICKSWSLSDKRSLRNFDFRAAPAKAQRNRLDRSRDEQGFKGRIRA